MRFSLRSLLFAHSSLILESVLFGPIVLPIYLGKFVKRLWETLWTSSQLSDLTCPFIEWGTKEGLGEGVHLTVGPRCQIRCLTPLSSTSSWSSALISVSKLGRVTLQLLTLPSVTWLWLRHFLHSSAIYFEVSLSETGLGLLVSDKRNEVSFPFCPGPSSPVGHGILDWNAVPPLVTSGGPLCFSLIREFILTTVWYISA